MAAPADQRDPLTRRVIGAAIEVHKHLGPGLLESAYEQCLCWELEQAGLGVQRQVPLPVVYKGNRLDIGYRIDMIIEGELVIEVKAVEKLTAVHDAQLLSYLKLGGWRKGLLLNFNTAYLRDGIVRRVL
ncbi:MAG: GxxExxY protein [Planctomycetes bacterium]|nr:GxxExxY protein [Planctomycetota bacterium]